LFIGGMRIFVETIFRKIISLYVSANMPTLIIKQLIKEETGYPTCQQGLISSGRLFQDETILADYTVQRESTLQLIERMRGC
jgi:hypothetical protein